MIRPGVTSGWVNKWHTQANVFRKCKRNLYVRRPVLIPTFVVFRLSLFCMSAIRMSCCRHSFKPDNMTRECETMYPPNATSVGRLLDEHRIRKFKFVGARAWSGRCKGQRRRLGNGAICIVSTRPLPRFISITPACSKSTCRKM